MTHSGRAVVTGAGGFIGSHLVDALIARGWPTLAMVRYISSGSVGFLDGRQDDPLLQIARGDVRDPDFLVPHLRMAMPCSIWRRTSRFPIRTRRRAMWSRRTSSAP
jgi:uncharacterized protein YbjT (DUF2867 family)